MNPLENSTDMILAILVLFIGPIMIFSGLFRSAGLLACEKEAHAFVNEIETERYITGKAYREFHRKMSELPGDTDIFICCEKYGSTGRAETAVSSSAENAWDYQDTISMEMIESDIARYGKYSLTPDMCVLIEVRYYGLVLCFRAYGGFGSRI